MSRLWRRTNGRTNGGKWKIEQCSVGPETAILHASYGWRALTIGNRWTFYLFLWFVEQNCIAIGHALYESAENISKKWIQFWQYFASCSCWHRRRRWCIENLDAMDAEYFLKELFTLVFMLLLMEMMVMTSILERWMKSMFENNPYVSPISVPSPHGLSCNFVESDDSIELLHRQGAERQI